MINIYRINPFQKNQNWIWVITSFTLAILFCIVNTPAHAQAQPCPVEEAVESKQLLALAQIYESKGAWEKAADIYAQVATSPCDSFAQVGREGLNRTLPYQFNWFHQLESEILDLSRTTAITSAQLIGAVILAWLTFYFGKKILNRIDEWRAWTILPFTDSSGNGLGEMVTESLVNTIHEARFIHSHTPLGLINFIDNSDLPSFSGMKQRDDFIAVLGGLDSFDVSGFGLPIGSILVTITRWFDLGGRRLEGNIRRINDTVEISVRLEEGRNSKCLKIWKESGVETGELKTSATLNELQERLSYRVLLDIVPVDWGTKSAEALCSFTNGLKHFLQADSQGISLHNKPSLHEARDAFEKARQYDPTYQMAMYNLALVELNLGNNDRAIELLKLLEEIV